MITAVPGFTPVTTPVELIVATDSSLELHLIFFSLAFEGETIPRNWKVAPTSRVSEYLSSETLSTGILGSTVTLQVAVKPPSRLVAVIVTGLFFSVSS